MDLTPPLILLLPTVGRIVLSIIQSGRFDIIFVEPSLGFLYCMGLGVLTYQTIMNASLFSGILVGLGSRAVLTYLFQGRRWTVLCGFLLGVFTSDVVTLFWAYINQESIQNARVVSRKRKKSTRSRRLSDPRRPDESLAGTTTVNPMENMQNSGEADIPTLTRQLAQAEADVRRVQEERKWAISSGNTARAMQLKWAVERSEALARSYRRELEEKQQVAQESIRSPGPSELSMTIQAPSERKVSVRHDSIISEPVQSDPEHLRLHTREHLTQRFTLEDGSEVQLTRLHLGRNNSTPEKKSIGRPIPVTIIESPTSDHSR
ncbi:SubName: Full=Uncharacterized protein {ECO:0000313/EMBL:CCA77761.1} [Serendipita indica DSM 11827]|nr:SubName: Full=Uncharacterized protein {ECO:0000313/EMBL:CCA77761.1} [Serendipita indica DSM 11827]